MIEKQQIGILILFSRIPYSFSHISYFSQISHLKREPTSEEWFELSRSANAKNFESHKRLIGAGRRPYVRLIVFASISSSSSQQIER